MRPGDKVGVRPPGVAIVVAALTTLYVCICGLATLAPGPLSVLLSTVLVLAELLAGARLLDVRHPSVPYLVVLWMLTAYTASVVGIRNHHAAYFQYRAAKEGRTYTNISPQDKASAHLDGGIITFAEGAVLSADESVGLRLNGVTYCAAPIVGTAAAPAAAPAANATAFLAQPAAAADGAAAASTATASTATASAATAAGPEVQFFAIGEGCCGARGQFECDDVAVSSTRGGIIWHEPSEGALSTRIFAPTSHRREYMKAVKASMALSDQKAAPHPVLLRWVSSPTSLLVRWLTQALLVWIITSVIYGIFIAALWFVVDFHFDRVMRGNVSEAMTGRADHYNELRPAPPGSKGAAAAPAAGSTSRFGLWRSGTPRRRDAGMV